MGFHSCIGFTHSAVQQMLTGRAWLWLELWAELHDQSVIDRGNRMKSLVISCFINKRVSLTLLSSIAGQPCNHNSDRFRKMDR